MQEHVLRERCFALSSAVGTRGRVEMHEARGWFPVLTNGNGVYLCRRSRHACFEAANCCRLPAKDDGSVRRRVDCFPDAREKIWRIA